jgi:hypothetical protein
MTLVEQLGQSTVRSASGSRSIRCGSRSPSPAGVFFVVMRIRKKRRAASRG